MSYGKRLKCDAIKYFTALLFIIFNNNNGLVSICIVSAHMSVGLFHLIDSVFLSFFLIIRRLRGGWVLFGRYIYKRRDTPVNKQG